MAYDVRGGAFAYETIAVSTTAIGPTAATIAPAAGKAQVAVINPADQDIRYTLDGTTPTASIGLRLAAGDTAVIHGYGNISRLLMIREDGTNSSVGCQYLR